MANADFLTYHDGKLEVPEQLREELRLKEGSRLHVVYATDQILLDRRDPESALPGAFDWHALRGALSYTDVDLNAELEEDRIREAELDARAN